MQVQQTYYLWNVQESGSQFSAESNNRYHEAKCASHSKSIQFYKRPLACIRSIIFLYSSLKYAFSKVKLCRYGRHTIFGMSKRVEVSSQLRTIIDIMRLNVLATAEAFNSINGHWPVSEVLFSCIVV